MTLLLTRQTETLLARAVDALLARHDTTALRHALASAPATDRQALRGATARDVFVTALRCWRVAAPAGQKLARTARVAALVLVAPAFYPRIAEAQRSIPA